MVVVVQGKIVVAHCLYRGERIRCNRLGDGTGAVDTGGRNGLSFC